MPLVTTSVRMTVSIRKLALDTKTKPYCDDRETHHFVISASEIRHVMTSEMFSSVELEGRGEGTNLDKNCAKLPQYFLTSSPFVCIMAWTLLL